VNTGNIVFSKVAGREWNQMTTLFVGGQIAGMRNANSRHRLAVADTRATSLSQRQYGGTS